VSHESFWHNPEHGLTGGRAVTGARATGAPHAVRQDYSTRRLPPLTSKWWGRQVGAVFSHRLPLAFL